MLSTTEGDEYADEVTQVQWRTKMRRSIVVRPVMMSLGPSPKIPRLTALGVETRFEFAGEGSVGAMGSVDDVGREVWEIGRASRRGSGW